VVDEKEVAEGELEVGVWGREQGGHTDKKKKEGNKRTTGIKEHKFLNEIDDIAYIDEIGV
jgi:hypothetical protein